MKMAWESVNLAMDPGYMLKFCYLTLRKLQHDYLGIYFHNILNIFYL